MATKLWVIIVSGYGFLFYGILPYSTIPLPDVDLIIEAKLCGIQFRRFKVIVTYLRDQRVNASHVKANNDHLHFSFMNTSFIISEIQAGETSVIMS